MNSIYNGDCIKVLQSIDSNTIDLIIVDPPFNIGLSYSDYSDNLSSESYLEWCNSWIKECYRTLKSNGSIYCVIGCEYSNEISCLFKKQGFNFRNEIVWHYGFGQSQRKKFSRSWTPILYYTKNKTDFTFNSQDILIPSLRQTKYNDPRAKSNGKVPDDVWSIPRLCGTHKERIKNKQGSSHPCQLPEQLVNRMILASSNSGDIVLDCFAGTGTTAKCCSNLNRQFITSDISKEYCSIIANRLKIEEKDIKIIAGTE
jgi:DNA modification methylase